MFDIEHEYRYRPGYGNVRAFAILGTLLAPAFGYACAVNTTGLVVRGIRFTPGGASIFYGIIAGICAAVALYNYRIWLQYLLHPGRVALTPTSLLIPKSIWSEENLEIPFETIAQLSISKTRAATKVTVSYTGDCWIFGPSCFASRTKFDEFCHLLEERTPHLNTLSSSGTGETVEGGHLFLHALGPKPVDPDFRKRFHFLPGSRSKVLAALAMVAVAAGAWLIAGDTAWLWTGIIASVVPVGLLIYLVAVKDERDLRRDHFFLCGYLALCCAVWIGVGYLFPLTRIRIEDGMRGQPAVPMRVSYAGELRSESPRVAPVSFTVRGRLRESELKIEMLSPSGWSERAFQIRENSVRLEDGGTCRLYIDNEGNGPVELTCGELRLRIDADRRQEIIIPAPDGNARYPLRVDGNDLGDFNDANVLIDISGNHAYRYRTVVYTTGLLPGLFDRRGPVRINLADLTGTQLRATGSEDERMLRDAHVHVLKNAVDLLFTPAPDTIPRPQSVRPTDGGRPSAGGLQLQRADIERRTELQIVP